MTEAAVLEELRIIREQIASLKPATEDTRRMLTERECEKAYRLAHGTVEADYRAGKLRGRYRSWRGPTGKALLISSTDAERLYGATYCTETTR